MLTYLQFKYRSWKASQVRLIRYSIEVQMHMVLYCDGITAKRLNYVHGKHTMQGPRSGTRDKLKANSIKYFPPWTLIRISSAQCSFWRKSPGSTHSYNGLIWCCYCMLQLSRNNQAMIKTSSSVHDSMFKKYFLKRVLWIKWLVIIQFWMKYLWCFCNVSSPHVSCIEGNVSDFPHPQAHRSRGALGLGMEWLQRRGKKIELFKVKSLQY